MNDFVATIDHPGAFIVEELEARGWTQVDLAYILGKSASQLSPILKGKIGISSDMAIAFGDAFDVSPEFFANLQKQYDLQNAKRPDPGVRTRAFWLSKFPVREMQDRGWIESSDADLLDLQMMRFFDANRIEDIPLVGANCYAHAAKRTGGDEAIGAQMAWLHRVRKIAEAIEAPPYSRDNLIAALPDIRAHMFDLEDYSSIPQLLLACGVRTVFVEKLPAGKIDGVCTWLGDDPVIGLSLRLNRPDNLSFVIRHEIEHILQGDGMDVGYAELDTFEPDRDWNDLSAEERRADEAAAEFLIPQDKMRSFLSRKGQWISEDDVLAFSARHHIHPSIVVGQIQHHRFKKTGDDKEWRFLRRYLTTKMHGYFENWPLRDGWGQIAAVGL